jgi:hypothetical protein
MAKAKFYKTEIEEISKKIQQLEEELKTYKKFELLRAKNIEPLWPNEEYIPLELSGLRYYDIFLFNTLKRAGIKYIEELKLKDTTWFLGLHRVGPARLNKLQSCLYRTWGFKLKE